jgi:hypothetical protein
LSKQVEGTAEPTPASMIHDIKVLLTTPLPLLNS